MWFLQSVYPLFVIIGFFHFSRTSKRANITFMRWKYIIWLESHFVIHVAIHTFGTRNKHHFTKLISNTVIYFRYQMSTIWNSVCVRLNFFYVVNYLQIENHNGSFSFNPRAYSDFYWCGQFRSLTLCYFANVFEMNNQQSVEASICKDV